MRLARPLLVAVACTLVHAAEPASASSPAVTEHEFAGPVSGRTIRYALHLPAGAADRSRRFPVVYWLHGATKEENRAWSRDLSAVAAALAAARRADPAIAEMIVVGVDGHGSSLYVDYKGREFLTETEIVRDLLPHIEATQPAATGRQRRALLGFSMGGCGAQMLAVKFPELFCAGVGLDGPTQIDDWEWAGGRALGGGNPFAGDRDYWKNFSPTHNAAQNAAALRGRTVLRHYRSSGIFAPALAAWQRTCADLALDFALIDLQPEINRHSMGEIFRRRGPEVFRTLSDCLTAPAR